MRITVQNNAPEPTEGPQTCSVLPIFGSLFLSNEFGLIYNP